MPMLDLTPDWQFLVFPKSAIPQRKIDAYVINEIAQDLITGVPSDWGGVFVKGSFGNGAGDWKRIGADLKLQNAGFARFLPDGTVERFPNSQVPTAFGGFYVTPTLRPSSSVAGNGLSPVAGQPLIPWNTASGVWETSPALAGRGTAILSRSQSGGTAYSQNPLTPNTGFETYFDFFSSDRGNAYLHFGPEVRLVVRQGQPPTIQRLTTQTTGQMQSSQWTDWRRLVDNEAFNPRGTRARFAVEMIGGRMVCSWNDKSIYLLDENEDENNLKGIGDRVRGKIPQWGGQLILRAENCRVRAETALLDYAQENNGGPRVATITRKVPLAAAGSYQPRLIEPVVRGFVPDGGDMSVSLTHDDDSLTVTTTITPDDQGFYSPVAAQIYLTYKPVWTNGSGNPVNFTAAVTDARITLAQPPDQAGSEGSVSIDLKVAQEKCAAAIPLLKDFAPFEVSARWKKDDGQPLTDYRGLMQGYLFGARGNIPGYNSTNLEFTLRDPIVRLQNEAGIVDGTFQDLICDYDRLTRERVGVALKDLKAANDTDEYQHPFEDNDTWIPVSVGAYYGGDAVKYILSNQLGFGTAAKLNGNGDVKRFLKPSHQPLLNRLDMAGSVAAVALALDATLGIGSLGGKDGGGFFPPPYGEDCLSWIQRLALDDGCFFCFGHVNRNTDVWPVPIYGQYEVFLDSAYGWDVRSTFSDAEANNIAAVMEKAGLESRPERDINRVLVWANPFGNEIPFAPAFVQGEARIAAGPNAPQNSWARTLVVRDEYAKWITTPAQASAVAAAILLDINNTGEFYPSVSIRGDARFLVGDVFFLSGLDLNINDQYLRVAMVEHSYTNNSTDGRDWKTEIELAPMTNSQIARFQANNNLRGGYTFS